jgi:hypothetical protein
LGKEQFSLIVKVAAPNGVSVRVHDGKYNGFDFPVVFFGGLTFKAEDFIKAISTLNPLTKGE